MEDYEGGSSAAACPVCFGTDMQWVGGSLNCMICGSQSQDFAMESQEYQQGIDDQRFRRRAQTVPVKRTGKRDAGEAMQFSAAAVIQTYVRCLQHGLQEQMRLLVENMGMQSAAYNIAHMIWTARLKDCRILETGTAEELSHMAEQFRARAVRRASDDSSSNEADMPKHVQPQSAYVRFLWQLLPPDTLLQCALLAAIVLREAVGPADFVRWTLSGRLPLLSLPPLCRPILDEAPSDFPLPLLQPSGLRDAHDLEVAAAELALAIELQLPPLNIVAHLQRAATSLRLPDAVWVAAVQLWHVIREGDDTCYLSSLPTTEPYAHVLPPLVVALKVLYGLGAPSARGPICAIPPPPADWLAWAQASCSRVSSPCDYPLSVEQAMSLNAKQRLQYAQFLRSKVFNHVALRQELCDVVSSLDAKAASLSLPDNQTSNDGDRQQPDATEMSQPHTQPAPHDPNTFAPEAHIEMDCGSAAKLARFGQLPTDSADQAQQAQHAQHAQHAQQAQQAEGAPAQTCIWSTMQHIQSRAEALEGHPDYLAVVVAVAAYGWVSPNLLHRLVVDFERDLAAAEAQLACSEDAAGDSQGHA